MPPRSIMLAGAAALMSLSLGACRGGEPAQVSEQDDGLTSNDPAVKGALGDAIMVDPELTGQSNTASATAGARPAEGGVPAMRGGTAAESQAEARRLVANRMLSAPAPGDFAAQCQGNCEAGPRPATLGGLARQQAGEGCAADVRYGSEWAARLPAAFPVYPRAALIEAAGVANSRCNVRIVNFQSRAGMQAVMDFYYTMARRNGFAAEHLLRGTEHYLGGTKGEEAFVVMARPMAGGVVDVDLVATGGR